ncbi:hypothetical protein Dda_2086 [Drechslerella dactyloides]|uniref:Uncharacterized protein n=1 Tax=Drechslerella dactyloides TaxID=74499 RepID=A0AAD6J494_DREDA|nr:hypothetical protein Dda_2086 [Drechslerella dactyloides]
MSSNRRLAYPQMLESSVNLRLMLMPNLTLPARLQIVGRTSVAQLSRNSRSTIVSGTPKLAAPSPPNGPIKQTQLDAPGSPVGPGVKRRTDPASAKSTTFKLPPNLTPRRKRDPGN